MNLHTINKTSKHSALYENMLSAVAPNDSILLIEDGVYSALTAYTGFSESLSAGVRILALEADVKARGLSGKVSKEVQIISDNEFVRLSCENAKIISWY